MQTRAPQKLQENVVGAALAPVVFGFYDQRLANGGELAQKRTAQESNGSSSSLCPLCSKVFLLQTCRANVMRAAFSHKILCPPFWETWTNKVTHLLNFRPAAPAPLILPWPSWRCLPSLLSTSCGQRYTHLPQIEGSVGHGGDPEPYAMRRGIIKRSSNSGNCVRPMFCLCIRPLIYWANPANMFKWRMCWTHVCVIFPYDIKSCHLTLFAALSSHLPLALTISNLLKHKSSKFGRKIFRLNAWRSMRGMRNAWPSCPRQHLLKFFHLGREIGRTLQLGVSVTWTSVLGKAIPAIVRALSARVYWLFFFGQPPS